MNTASVRLALHVFVSSLFPPAGVPSIAIRVKCTIITPKCSRELGKSKTFGSLLKAGKKNE